jgi:tRNA (cmo5U34)-methyltransferase
VAKVVSQSLRVKAHFDSEFSDYDFCADKVVPRNLDLQRALLGAIPFYKRARLRTLDLGVGTGQTSALVLQAFPNARVCGIDLSDSMLEIARRRLSRYGSRVSLVQGDFCAEDLSTLGGSFDVVFSAVSVHNCLDSAKRDLFGSVARALRGGGVFVNADFVKFSLPAAQSVAQADYVDFLRWNLGGKEFKHWLKHASREDKPASLEDQFAWLLERGFKRAEKTYSFENTAVYRAFK